MIGTVYSKSFSETAYKEKKMIKLKSEKTNLEHHIFKSLYT